MQDSSWVFWGYKPTETNRGDKGVILMNLQINTNTILAEVHIQNGRWLQHVNSVYGNSIKKKKKKPFVTTAYN